VPSPRVLVAEDFDAFRDYVCRELQHQTDCAIDAVADGLTAVERAREWQPDLVLLDIGLPRLNGIAAGQQIRVLCPDAKIVFLTQESSPEIVQAALGVGAQGYIRKVRAQDYLLDTVDAVLSGSDAAGRSARVQVYCHTAQGHHAHFYGDDASLIDSMAHFVASALVAQDGAIVLATAPHLEVLSDLMRRGGVDVDAAILRGTFRPLDAAGTLAQIVTNGVVDADRFHHGLLALIESTARATTRERPRIAIFGECGSLLCESGLLDQALRLERTGNELVNLRNGPVLDIICAYPLMPSGTDTSFKRICTYHSAVAVR
jgi:CheY-like chemotaxis protein